MTKTSKAKLAYMAEYQKQPENAAKGVERKRNRRAALREGTVHVGDGKEIDHKKMLEESISRMRDLKVGISSMTQAVETLSGGQRQRIAIARALMGNPRVLLMDEPFSALDALTREQLYGDLQEIFTKRKKTIVLVTHNIREAVCLGDRVVLFSPNPGRVQQVFDVNLPRPRRMNDPALASLAAEVTEALTSHPAK
mgnify:CR=1 FL=1